MEGVLIVLICSLGYISVMETPIDETTNHKGLVAIAGMSTGRSVSICAGTLISKHHILTSALCIEHLPGTLSIFSAGRIGKPSTQPWPGETILDSKDVIGCVNERIFHPCYRKPSCAGSQCVPQSWRYDLAIVRTSTDLTKAGIDVDNGIHSVFEIDKVKSCVVFGFRPANRTGAATFIRVVQKVNATRTDFLCDDWHSMASGMIRSVEGNFAELPDLSLSGGQLICDSVLYGVLMGKIEGRFCQVIRILEKNRGDPVWLGFTYLNPYIRWILSIQQKIH